MPSSMARPSISRKRAIVQSIALVFLLFAASASAPAQMACGSLTDDSAPALDSLLTNDPTCAAAHARLKACAWGSSADDQFAAIVIKKCEGDFLASLGARARRGYARKVGACANDSASQSGTLFQSIRAICATSAAHAYAVGAAKAKKR